MARAPECSVGAFVDRLRDLGGPSSPPRFRLLSWR